MLRVSQFLDNVELLPELRTAFTQMLLHDQQYLTDTRPWMCVIPALQQGFSANDAISASLDQAWRLMYAAICRLDALQDHDPITDRTFAALDPSIQYNQVLSWYVFANAILDQAEIPDSQAVRWLRLRRLWSAMLLRMASGQQRDLLAQQAGSVPHSLQYYQETAQFKTGATFALAFGGVAILNSDDQALINTLALIGEVYGTLLQYSDDMGDQQAQPHATYTLPAVLRHASIQASSGGTAPTVDAMFEHVCKVYLAQVLQWLPTLPVSVQHTVRTLLQETFRFQLLSSERLLW